MDKLQILLEQLGWDDNSFFENGSLTRIISKKGEDYYCFHIKLDKMLPTNIYEKFINRLEKSFIDVKNVCVFFEPKEINYDYVSEYYQYVIEKYSDRVVLLSMLKNNEVEIKNNELVIKVINKVEKSKISSIKEEIKEEFEHFGYGKIGLKVLVDEEESKKIQKEINNSLSLAIRDDVLKRKLNPESSIVLGNEIKSRVISMDSIISEESDVTVEGHIFGLDFFESSKTNFKIITLKITDYTNSIYCKIFTREDSEYNRLKKAFKVGNWYKIRGYTKMDEYAKELVLNARDINVIEKEKEEIVDDAEVKRVELHTHTFMSQMDGLVDPKTLVNEAYKLGHKAIAITDHNGVQSYPEVFNAVNSLNKGKEGNDRFKAIYGVELTMVDDNINIVIRGNDTLITDNTYVVFDVETTGFNAAGGDTIIEIGAVKIFNGEIIDKFSTLVNPGRKLPAIITEITKITDEMLIGQPTEEEAVKDFIDWIGDSPLVAHNAKFDISFLEMAYSKYNLGDLTNPVIDTLELSRTLDNTYNRHGLAAIVKRYDVPFDEDAHHRADYDAEATAYVFHKMMQKLVSRNFETINDINNLVSKDEIHKYGRTYHVNILAKNRDGLKNMFKLISLANTKYLHKTPRILRSEIERYRNGLLIGSGCYESEVFIEARSKTDEEMANIIKFYDYVEVQPLSCYDHLLQMGDFANRAELMSHVIKIIRLTKDSGAIMVATGDVHHLRRDDKIYREIIVNQKVPGGGRHPLARNNITSIPSMHFRTTNEMLEEFDFLEAELAKEIIIDNTHKIADMIEEVEVFLDTKGVPFSPKMENSVQIVKDMVYGNAHEIYGDPLPEIIAERIEQELTGIIKGGYDVIYLISQKLVRRSNEEGYLVGSRGSVGSSFVATLMGITEVNPLPAHYVCPSCKTSIFEENGILLGSEYSSGYDLPDRKCDKCNIDMIKEGQDMPFATFLGFNADKVPDIDLNFSGEYQSKAHDYTKELFGEDYVYRAGTIGTVADKTAFGFVKGYFEDRGITNVRTAEVERLAMGCTGVKRTTGQHPGGIVVVPDYMEVFDFTPYQFPADSEGSLWKTTHFDYGALEDSLLKLDILGHDDPTTLRMLQDLSGIDVTKINLTDPDVMKLFSSPEVLGVTSEQIMCETGTLGVPEMGTKFVIGMLSETKPTTFSELLKISGLSHGTDVWLGNARDLIMNNVIEFKDVIGCRDDIMVYLMYNGLEAQSAFKIMEFVRKGRPSKDPETWEKYAIEMKEAGIPDWYIDSCQKIKYMFPKAHAAAYVMSALRIAWFKVHMPIIYYAAYFSVRCHDFDIDAMINGYDAIRRRIIEINEKGYDATNKENSVADVLAIALEATARGFKFANVDLMKSDSVNFIIADDKTLIPPFRTIDGLGETVARKIVEERDKGEFISIEDLQNRARVSSTLIERMRSMGVLDGMDESSQLTLF